MNKFNRYYIGTIIFIIVIMSTIIVFIHNQKNNYKISEVNIKDHKQISNKRFDFNIDNIREYLDFKLKENKFNESISPYAKIKGRGIVIKSNTIKRSAPRGKPPKFRQKIEFSLSLSKNFLEDELCARDPSQVGFVLYLDSSFEYKGDYIWIEKQSRKPLLRTPLNGSITGWQQSDKITIVNWITKEIVAKEWFEGGLPPEEFSSDRFSRDINMEVFEKPDKDKEKKWVKYIVNEKLE